MVNQKIILKKLNEVSKAGSDAEAKRQQWAILPRLILKLLIV